MIAFKEKDREGFKLHGHKLQCQWSFENGGSKAECSQLLQRTRVRRQS